ncbi:hypothetical protein AJ80_03355 [Polytolypa hystricis UAMH7299]|uniref:LCCL domain-containing protein n=1 Tax=Polytolypa hystricis (strain UAMH7299) TaxID=1447883 RepID=A0A2B7YJ30_POLH7|nr:hypothetical protein AJ80_03355 [Polytolypa hystricis UAMH7299]
MVITQSDRRQYELADLENGDGYTAVVPHAARQSFESTTPTTPAREEEEEAHLDFEVLEYPHWTYRILPSSIQRLVDKTAEWVQGPTPPRPFHITGIFESIQTAPSRLLQALVPKWRHQVCLAIAFYLLWLLLFVAILSRSGAPADIGGHGPPVKLSCTSRLWRSSSYCGLDGQDCLPFDNHTVAFTCPAECRDVMVLEPYTIGVEEINYQSLIVGGGSDDDASSSNDDEMIYRGDSFICAAAIHAGILSNRRGGCGVLSRVGERHNYQAVERNGLSSVGFNSSFPLSFTFIQGEGEESDGSNKCQDPRWKLLILTAIFTALISLFSTTPLSFFYPIFTIIYFQVSLASDPPPFANYPTGLSWSLERFLPAACVSVLIYKYCVRHTLHDMSAHFEKTIFWVGTCWIGALSSYTLDKMIPIQRLTPHDIAQQPGAIPALIIIITILLTIAAGQIYAFRIEGRLPRYLRVYTLFVLSLLIMVLIPGLNLRIHHYILALLLLPGTALQTRPSLLYQGFLVGLFINGIARWGFATILDTPAALRGDDGQLGSALPTILAPTALTVQNVSFTWSTPSAPAEGEEGWDGISVLVNDVERYRSVFGSDSGSGSDANETTSFTWTRLAQDEDLPEYFRFAYVKYLPLGGVTFGDYTKAGVWDGDGGWVHMEPGPSR